MIFLDERDVQSILTLELMNGAVRASLIQAANGSGAVNPVVIGRGFKDGQTFSIKSGSAPEDGVIGLKVGSFWPDNPKVGLARHASTIIMIDPDTGKVCAVIEASKVNGPRTAAANAVATDLLARSDARTLSVLGAGAQARHEIRALCAIRRFERILVGARSPASVQTLIDDLADLPLAIEGATIEAACRAADVLTTITPSRAPLFDAGWIRAGTHISTMGSDQVGKQELPVPLLETSGLFCDLPRQSLTIGEYQHIADDVAEGRLTITAIGDALCGRAPGRNTDSEITIFDSSGIALQDLLVAQALIRQRGSSRAAFAVQAQV